VKEEESQSTNVRRFFFSKHPSLFSLLSPPSVSIQMDYDDAVLVFDPPELVWRGVRLNKVRTEDGKREPFPLHLARFFPSRSRSFAHPFKKKKKKKKLLSTFPPPHLPQPQTAKLTITSRLNASLDLDLKPVGSGRDRLRILSAGSSKILLPPRGSASVEVEVRVDGAKFRPGPLRLKAAAEGIRDAVWVKGLYFDLKVPATWFLDEADVAGMTTTRKGGNAPPSPLAAAASASVLLSRSPVKKKLPRLPAMPSPSPVKRIAADRDNGGAFGGGHASPASLSEDEGGKDWGAPPSPPAPSSHSRQEAAAVAFAYSNDLFDAGVDGPVEVDQAWLGGGGVESGREEEEEEVGEEAEEGQEGEGFDEEEFGLEFALPRMPAFGSSSSSLAVPPPLSGEEAAKYSPLRAVDELLSSQDRRERGARQVLRAQKEEEEEEEEEEDVEVEVEEVDESEERHQQTPATAPRAPRPPSHLLHHPPATAVSRAAALEAVLAQQEGANAELRTRVRELALSLGEARALAASALARRALAATAALEGAAFPPSNEAAADSSSVLLEQERAERRARDAAVLKLLRAKDDSFSALEVKAADAAARASEERRGREQAERERDSLAARVRNLSAELAARRDGGGGGEREGEGEGAATNAAEKREEEGESQLVSSLRLSLARAEEQSRELEAELERQRALSKEATRTAENAAQRAELLTSRLEAAVAAASSTSPSSSSSPSASEAASAAAAFSSYRQERQADALRFEAAVYAGLAALSSFSSSTSREGGLGNDDGGENGVENNGAENDFFLKQHRQHQQRLLLLSTSQPLPPPLPPSLTAGNLAATVEAALAVDGATSAARERAVREATTAAAAVAKAAAEEAARARAKKKNKARKEAAEAAEMEAAAAKERAAGLEGELAARERVLRELRGKAEELQARLARSESGDGGGKGREGEEEKSEESSARVLLLSAARCSLRSALRSAEAMRAAAGACGETTTRNLAAAAAAPAPAPLSSSVQEAARVAGLTVEEAADLLGVGCCSQEAAAAAAAPSLLPPLPSLSRVVAAALDEAEVAAAAGGEAKGEGGKLKRVAAAAEAVAKEAAEAEGVLADAVARLLPSSSFSVLAACV